MSKPSKIISFRVPQDLAVEIDIEAKKKGQKRADLVFDLFISSFKKLIKSKTTLNNVPSVTQFN